jgi:4'-phosphopantetheinyl transferase
MSNPSAWLAPPKDLALANNEIHVWRARLDLNAESLERMRSTLAGDEQTRADRFHFDRDRNHFLACRGILRELLGSYLNRSPTSLAFSYGAFGKPALRLEDSSAPIHFNVAHSNGLALLAFARRCEIGIDLESIRADFAGDEIAQHYFSKQELTELRALPETMRTVGFFECWTRKEAYIKARGLGLQIPLQSFSVSLTPDQPETLQSEDASRWKLRSIDVHPAFAGAIAAEGHEWQLRFWDWTASLPIQNERCGKAHQ